MRVLLYNNTHTCTGYYFRLIFLMYFPGMKLCSKIFSFIDIFMATYQRSPKTETAGPPGERVQPFAIPAHPCGLVMNYGVTKI